MRKTLLSALALLSLLFASISQAAVMVGATRLIYDGKQNEANLAVSNREDDSPYLVQSWVSQYGTGNDASLNTFIVTPPLFRLDANKENIVRVIFTGGGDVPQDQESMFLMNVKAIPATRDDQRDANVLQIALKTTIKLFYRPAGLNGSPKEAVAALDWQAAGGTLSVYNPSKFHVVVSDLKVNGTALTAQTDVLKPGEHRVLPVKGSSGDQISLSYIDDYGTSITAPAVTLR
ncbi:molecular chaperone [Pseudomonas parafulva]|uniref:Molecular chaperone n=1 Tax=Pseudomonas parafulva TaxID=157782 RepID=A0AAI8KGD1_9PSED|nr:MULTISPECIES: molecular chaperone [Pseudomonas]AIZ35687.1 fimbrial chaperone protein [Pseudomonas parafulva]ATB68026.1 fimbrial chaperone protein [Pseudomonas mosselii]AXO90954.1 molecular chaperone [Pseudomonas parafulva]